MKALLLIAHGSRRRQSNNEVMRLADKLKHHCMAQYEIVHGGFLELSDPMIPEAIKLCVDEGATSIVILPYFLNSGRHVIEDIPNIVRNTQHKYPQVEIKIAAHLGASEMMMDLLTNAANAVTLSDHSDMTNKT